MNDITVLIPVSPIPSHPSTEVIDQTVASVRERLPDSEIIIMFDGVKPENMNLKTQYDQFTQALLWKINNEMGNAVPIVSDHHAHQSGLVKQALPLVRTPLILFLEQDTPLHNDIPFDKLTEPLKTGYINLLRFHFEAQVHPEHEHLMLDKTPIDILGQPFLRTKQWSQRPHLARTDYYRYIAEKYWDNQPRFIEHIMYGLVAEGGDNYDEHRLHIYSPPGTLVRSLHLDGRRKGAANYDPTPS